MDLWIRSQDKEILTKINKSLDIEEIRKDVNYLKDYKDNRYLIESEDYILGTYQTKERALEVLDEIQELILKLDKRITHYELDCVYEMPKE